MKSVIISLLLSLTSLISFASADDIAGIARLREAADSLHSIGRTDSAAVVGEVPAIYADYQAQRDKIEESAQKSEASYKKASSQIDELKEQYRARIEEAGKKLDGQPIEISTGADFKVVSPVSLSFKEFANSVNSMYDVKAIYDDAKDYTENGHAMVCLNGKWGLIDSKGFAIIPCVYDSMSDMFNGWYEVSKDDVWGYVSRTGNYAASYQEYEQKRNASKEP